MTDRDLSLQLQVIESKLDEISAELAEARKQRQEMEDLKEDLTRVAKDLFQSAVEELEDIAPFVNSDCACANVIVRSWIASAAVNIL